MTLPESVPTKKQTKTWGKDIERCGKSARMTVTARYDDQCGNGHNTFALTAAIWLKDERRRDCESYGCLHDTIAREFPELAPLIKWHLVSSDGPMYYPSSVLYHAGDRDCWGHRAGEPGSFDHTVQFGLNPIRHRLKESFATFLQTEAPKFDLEVLRIDHGKTDRSQFRPKYTFGGYADKWHKCPFNTEEDALDFLAALQDHLPKFGTIATDWSKGKARELDSARNCAVWPEATDEELTAPDLKEKLLARLPALMEEFKRVIEGLGFVY